MDKASLNSVLQIVTGLHDRLTKLESAYSGNHCFLGVGNTNSSVSRRTSAIRSRGEIVADIVRDVISYFNWDASDRNERVKDENQILISILDTDGLDYLKSLSKDAKVETLKQVLWSFGQSSEALAAVISLEIVFQINVLSREDIAKCITNIVLHQYGDGSRKCKDVIRRFLTMIKNKIDGGVCSRCITHWPSLLPENQLDFLKSYFESSGFKTTGYYHDGGSPIRAPSQQGSDSADFNDWGSADW